MRRHLAFHKVRLETRKILVDERNTMLGQLQPKARVEALYSTSGKALPLPQRPNAHLPRFDGLERLKGASSLAKMISALLVHTMGLGLALWRSR
jgi:hypothetical protein